MNMKFSKATKEKLGFYVYALVDPRNDKIFYVGKASANNRAFDHLKTSKDENRKLNLIRDIRNSGHSDPRVDILRYGLTEDSVFQVEAAIIDSLGLENLTNEVRGHGIGFGRILARDIERLHGSKPISISKIGQECIAFFISKTYSPTLSEQSLYDCTRQFWYEISEETRNSESIKIALSVVDNVVVRVYGIESWFPAGSTFSSRKFKNKSDNRWEFVGNIITDHELVGRLLENDDGSPLIASQRGYTYLPRS
jgi:hypothetical protein